MRISTSNFYNNTTTQLNELQSSISNLSTQVSTGKKGITPQDDPAAAVQILSLSQVTSADEQYTKNRVALKNSLGSATSALNGIVDTLQGVNEQVVYGSTGSLSNQDRSTIATTLSGQLSQLISLANSNDGAGHYLFSGFNVASTPSAVSLTPGSVSINGTPVSYDQYSYQGTSSSAQIQVDVGRTAGLGVTVADLFGSDASNFLNKLSKAITVLSNPSQTSSDATSALNDVATSFKTTFDNVLKAQSKVGITQNQLEAIDVLSVNKGNSNAKVLSALQDTDYNKTLSDLARQQVQLQAAQKSFQQISSLSLFNYIN
jgi:flagellar hook-associated protein 3 FlgL